ncbi:bifunctional folylpolyglutamate synthase/dihydrofolate synthase [Candidatus Woesearchaeota archaeon]|nr:bifunctional folylpolyglutamate synthase/dihydrofolate synthase [Candidatus Woesearchaeota archaeon]
MHYQDLVNELLSKKRLRINPHLDSIKKILSLFGNPQQKLSCVHVAGTNGKGSVCAMLASIFLAQGKKVGLYTSPHLIDVTERIVVNDKSISQEQFCFYGEKILKYSLEKNVDLTFFEIVTAMAFLYFSDEQVDVVVLETGLGGTWDAANVVMPLVSVITNVTFDHTDILGKDLVSIAKEKAGIIKEKISVVTAAEGEALEVLRFYAEQKHAPLIVAKPYSGNISLHGDFQKVNAGVAYAVARVLGVDEECIQKGIATAYWPGRCEFLNERLLIDGAHNPAGVLVLRDYVDSLSKNYEGVVIVFGVNKTKDYETMLSLLPEHDILIVTQSQHPDALDPAEIGQGIIIPDPVEAVKSALSLRPKALIVCCGSLYFLGDVIHAFKKNDDRGKRV